MSKKIVNLIPNRKPQAQAAEESEIPYDENSLRFLYNLGLEKRASEKREMLQLEKQLRIRFIEGISIGVTVATILFAILILSMVTK